MLQAMKKFEVLENPKLVGLILCVDRQEKMGDAVDVGDKSAVQNLEDEFGFKTFAILKMEDIFRLVRDGLSDEIRQEWIDYFKKYGVVDLSNV